MEGKEVKEAISRLKIRSDINPKDIDISILVSLAKSVLNAKMPEKKEITPYKSGVSKKEKCSCGFNQSYPIPHTHDMTKRELEIKKGYEFELGLWETRGYNQAIDECNLIIARDYIHKDKLLSVEEIAKIIDKALEEPLPDEDITTAEELAQAIHSAQQEKMKG